MKWQQVTLLTMALYVHSVAVANTSAQDSYATVNNLEVEVLALDPSILPKANFQVSATEGTVPFTVVFDAGLSANGREYEWFFGDDDTTAQGVRVEHTYTEAGGHPVILRVKSGEHEDYVHTYIQAGSNEGIGYLPEHDRSDPLNFFKRNRQYVQNELYGFGMAKLLDYISIDDIRAMLTFAWPGKESVLYEKYNYDSKGIPQQSGYGDYVAMKLDTGETNTFHSLTLRSSQTRGITTDAKYVIHGGKYGEVYIINTLTGGEEVIFAPDIEGDDDRMYDTLDLAVSPDDTEIIFMLSNIVSDGVGGRVSELPHYIIKLPITARNQTLASVEPFMTVPFGTEAFNEFYLNQIVWWDGTWYVLTEDKELIGEEVENKNLSRVQSRQSAGIQPFQNDTRMLDDDFRLPPMSLPWSSNTDLSISQGYMGDPTSANETHGGKRVLSSNPSWSWLTRYCLALDFNRYSPIAGTEEDEGILLLALADNGTINEVQNGIGEGKGDSNNVVIAYRGLGGAEYFVEYRHVISVFS